MRIEKDFLGPRTLPMNVLYGIHSLRASENFPYPVPFHIEWYQSVGMVKLASYKTYRLFRDAIKKEMDVSKVEGKFMDDIVLGALENSALDIMNGLYFTDFIVPACQGGAGTSINMNVNEIISNVALLKTGHHAGDYQYIDPIEQANVFQSTNDVIPTSLHIAAMLLLQKLELKINDLRTVVEDLEKKHLHTLRVGYTQMQEAVPSSYGRLFGTYAATLSRDWWRISKCWERIKVVNMGGGAIGTGIGIPRFFILNVVQQLQLITNLPVSRGEDLQDATSNLDSIAEVHGILKVHAVNLEKMVNDIRLVSSDLYGNPSVSIPKRQVGSSIMPGKINPVIVEYIISIAHQIYANDQLITSLAALGCLELNAYIPQIGHALLDSIKLLCAADQVIEEFLFVGLNIDKKQSAMDLYFSPSVTTALSPYIGYHKASEIALEMKKNKLNVFEANQKLKLMEENLLKSILEPGNLLSLGYSLKDIIKKI